MSTSPNPPDREHAPIMVMGALLNGAMLMEYRIEHVLGKPGGFGITYLSTDTNLEKKVAIKEYLPTDFAMRSEGASISIRSMDDREAFEWGMKSFLNEARTLARYKHPNVVQVHRLFEANHTAYIVMEYVEGDTLSEFLRRKSGITEIELKQILLPIADGLDTVHKSGVLHRDIKPHNIILRRDGTPVLIDFGAARNSLGSKTRSIISILTAGYAPIEQYSEVGDQGPWTDIYALAAVAYAAISGKTPPDAINRLNNDPMKPAVVLGEGRFSRPFLEALDWALRMKREDRPQNLGDWRAALSGAKPVPPPKKKVVDSFLDTVDFDLTPPAPEAVAPPPPPPGRPAPPALDLMATIVQPLSSLMETQDVAPEALPPKVAPPPAAPTVIPPAKPPVAPAATPVVSTPAAKTPPPPAAAEFEKTMFAPRREAAAPPSRPPPPDDDVTLMRTIIAPSPGMAARPPPARVAQDDATVIRPTNRGGAVPGVTLPPGPAKPAAAAPASSTGGRKWLPLAVLGGVAILVIGLLVWLVWGGSSSPSKTVAEAPQPTPPVAAPASEAPSSTENPPPAAAAAAPATATATPAPAPAPADATPAPTVAAATPAATPPPPASNPSNSISTIPENGPPPTKVAAAAVPPAKPAAPKPKPQLDAKTAKPASAAPASNLAATMLPQVQGSWTARVKQPSVALDNGCSVAAYRTWKLVITGLSGDQGHLTGSYSVDVNGRSNSGCTAPEFNVGSTGSFVGKPVSANQIQLNLSSGACNGDCAVAGKLLSHGSTAGNAQLVMIGDKVISISIIDNGLNYVFTNR